MRISEMIMIHSLIHRHTGIGTPIFYPGHIARPSDAYRVFEYVMKTPADADGTVVIPGHFLIPDDFRVENFEDMEEYVEAAQHYYDALERVTREELSNLSYEYESEDGEECAWLRIIEGCGGSRDKDGRLRQCTVTLAQVFDAARRLGHCPEDRTFYADKWHEFELRQDTVSYSFDLSIKSEEGEEE